MNNITIKQLIQQAGTNPDAMRMRWVRCGNTEFNQERTVTPEELERYTAKFQPVPPAATKPKLSTAIPVQNTKTTTKPLPTRWQAIRENIGIYDLLMWADLVLGTYSLFIIFGPLAGALVGAKISLFFEKARRIMRRRPTNLTGVEYTTPAYQKGLEHNDRLRRTKVFVTGIAIALSFIFAWANGQNFYRAILANTPDLAANNIADYAARVFAIVVTTIALSAMHTINLESNTNHGK